MADSTEADPTPTPAPSPMPIPAPSPTPTPAPSPTPACRRLSFDAPAYHPRRLSYPLSPHGVYQPPPSLHTFNPFLPPPPPQFRPRFLGYGISPPPVHNHPSVSDQPSPASSKGLLGINPFAWIDLEMMGIDPNVHRILEIAIILTCCNLTRMIEGPTIVIHQEDECLQLMDKWNTDTHVYGRDDGLAAKSVASTISESEAEKMVLKFIDRHIDMDELDKNTGLQLAGSSIYTDVGFLKQYMPTLAERFRHVLVDASSVNSLAYHWFKREYYRTPTKPMGHHAMDDIRGSIRLLQFYKSALLLSQLQEMYIRRFPSLGSQ